MSGRAAIAAGKSSATFTDFCADGPVSRRAAAPAPAAELERPRSTPSRGTRTNPRAQSAAAAGRRRLICRPVPGTSVTPARRLPRLGSRGQRPPPPAHRPGTGRGRGSFARRNLTPSRGRTECCERQRQRRNRPLHHRLGRGAAAESERAGCAHGFKLPGRLPLQVACWRWRRGMGRQPQHHCWLLQIRVQSSMVTPQESAGSASSAFLRRCFGGLLMF